MARRVTGHRTGWPTSCLPCMPSGSLSYATVHLHSDYLPSYWLVISENTQTCSKMRFINLLDTSGSNQVDKLTTLNAFLASSIITLPHSTCTHEPGSSSQTKVTFPLRGIHCWWCCSLSLQSEWPLLLPILLMMKKLDIAWERAQSYHGLFLLFKLKQRYLLLLVILVLFFIFFVCFKMSLSCKKYVFVVLVSVFLIYL